MNSVVVNRAGSMRVLSNSTQCDAAFRWIGGEAPSEYAGEPCSFTDNVKRVLMHGLSWYQFKVQHGYFNFVRGSSGLHLQNKTWSFVSIYWPLPLWLKAVKTVQRVWESLWSILRSGKTGTAHHRMKWWPDDFVQEVAPIWTTSHGTLGRWHPSRDTMWEISKVKAGKHFKGIVCHFGKYTYALSCQCWTRRQIPVSCLFHKVSLAQKL